MASTNRGRANCGHCCVVSPGCWARLLGGDLMAVDPTGALTAARSLLSLALR